MPRVKGLNRHQERFLSRLRSHPDGLPVELWPRREALCRWLDNPVFIRKFSDHHEAAATLGRVNLAMASSRAMNRLAAAVEQGPELIPALLAVVKQAQRHSGRKDPLVALVKELMNQA